MQRRTSLVQLAQFFCRNGYVRRADPVRQDEGSQQYKKGAEVRLVAESEAELRTIRRLLRDVGFTPGRPFRKGRQWRQPLYGVEAVDRFLALIGPYVTIVTRPVTPAPRRRAADRDR